MSGLVHAFAGVFFFFACCSDQKVNLSEQVEYQVSLESRLIQWLGVTVEK